MKAAAFSLPMLPVLALLLGCGGKVVFDEVGGASSLAPMGTSSATKSESSTTSVTPVSSSNAGGCEQFDFHGIRTSCTQEGITCLMADSCCDAVAARCASGTWIIAGATSSCNDTACHNCFNELSCGNGTWCISGTLPNTNDRWSRCAKDPCANQAEDCTCAEPACADNGQSCVAVGNVLVDCD